MPHGHCYLWQSDLIWLHVLCDAVIAASYMSIPFMLGYFMRRRRDLPFAAFIVSCGMTHSSARSAPVEEEHLPGSAWHAEDSGRRGSRPPR